MHPKGIATGVATVLVAMGLVGASATAQTWQRISALPTGFTLADVVCVGSDTVYAAGREGDPLVGFTSVFIRSFDRGATWEEHVFDGLILMDLSFVDGMTGYAAGTDVYKTTDGGNTWVQTSAPGWAVAAVGPDTATAVGYYGSIKRTTDGGATWAPQSRATDQSLRSVDFVDGMHGLAVGGPVILRTQDGGASWSVVDSLPGHYLRQVVYSSPSNAVIVGDTLLRSTDGGATWAAPVSSPFSNVQDVSFADASHGVMGSWGGKEVAYTSDGGATWTQAQVSNPLPLGDIFHVALSPAGYGYGVGNAGHVWRSTDWGGTWVSLYRGVPPIQTTSTYDNLNYHTPDLWSIEFSDSMGIITGYNTILRTSVDGSVVDDLATGSGLFISDSTLYSIGDEWLGGNSYQHVMKYSTDGGVTWTTRQTLPGTFAWSLDRSTGWAFADSLHGVVVDRSAFYRDIWRTSDGGNSWDYVHTSDYNFLGPQVEAVAMGDTAHVVWSKSIGGVSVSQDGGITWQDVSTPTLLDITFTGPTTVIGVGYSGTIVRSLDGGLTWNATTNPDTSDLERVEFYDAATGYAMSKNGTVVATSDSGKTWSSTVVSPYHPLADLAIAPSGDVYVVGDVGTIYRLRATPTGVKVVSRIPSPDRLFQNVPNPFNPTTTIRYTLSRPTHVTLRVYSVSGQLVRTLVDRYQRAGARSVVWDGRNDRGASVASGVYFYRLETDNTVDARKMVLLK